MLIKDMVEQYKELNKTAIIYKDIHYTYADFYTACSCLERRLSTVSGNIAIFLPNSYEYVVAFFSIAFAKRKAVPISVNSTASELKKTLKHCDASLIITDSKNFDNLTEKFVDGDKVVDIYQIDKNIFVKGNILHDNLSFYDENPAFLLVHTSGSVSHPKRVMLSQTNLITNALSITKSLQLTKDDISIIVLPLYLISAITSQMLAHLLIGATIVILEQPFVANTFWAECSKHAVTNLTCVPTILNLLTMRKSSLGNLSKLRMICFGGAPTGKSRIAELIEEFPNVNFVHMYGQTEAAARLTHLLPEDFSTNIGSVGKPIPDVEMKVVNSEGFECEPMVIGEVCAKGGNIMLGYYNDDESTRLVLNNEWLHTGDLGYVDHNGFYYIVGRKKNVIISGGRNIYPEEIEETLLLHEKVIDVMAYGVEDDLLGEVVCVKIVAKEKMEANEVYRHCSKLLSSYKIPQRIEFIKQIEKTPTGKIKRGNHG